MTIQIDLLPDEERALVDQARRNGQDPDQFARQIIRTCLANTAVAGSLDRGLATSQRLEDLIDHDFIADCAPRQDEAVPSIEEVRKTLTRIPGSLADEILADREDRF